MHSSVSSMKEAVDELQSKLTDLALEQLPEDQESLSDTTGAAHMPPPAYQDLPHTASMPPNLAPVNVFKRPVCLVLQPPGQLAWLNICTADSAVKNIAGNGRLRCRVIFKTFWMGLNARVVSAAAEASHRDIGPENAARSWWAENLVEGTMTGRQPDLGEPPPPR